uniref:Uncharacterized protein n=1 Tax=Megaselia scalaris TaxID=36166 RepID=T1GUG8_MEGSC
MNKKDGAIVVVNYKDLDTQKAGYGSQSLYDSRCAPRMITSNDLNAKYGVHPNSFRRWALDVTWFIYVIRNML